MVPSSIYDCASVDSYGSYSVGCTIPGAFDEHVGYATCDTSLIPTVVRFNAASESKIVLSHVSCDSA